MCAFFPNLYLNSSEQVFCFIISILAGSTVLGCNIFIDGLFKPLITSLNKIKRACYVAELLICGVKYLMLYYMTLSVHLMVFNFFRFKCMIYFSSSFSSHSLLFTFSENRMVARGVSWLCLATWAGVLACSTTFCPCWTEAMQWSLLVTPNHLLYRSWQLSRH